MDIKRAIIKLDLLFLEETRYTVTKTKDKINSTIIAATKLALMVPVEPNVLHAGTRPEKLFPIFKTEYIPKANNAATKAVIICAKKYCQNSLNEIFFLTNNEKEIIGLI